MDEASVSQVNGLVARIVSAQKEIDVLEAEVSQKKKDLQVLKDEMKMILEELGQSSFSSPLATISIKERWRVSLPKSEHDRQSLFEYLKKRGLYNSMVSVNSNTLNSFYLKEREAAAERGELMLWSIPGIEPPSLFKDVSVRVKQQGDKEL